MLARQRMTADETVRHGRWQRGDLDRRFGQSRRDLGLCRRVDDHPVGSVEQRAHQRLIEPSALVRQDVVADDDGSRATASQTAQHDPVGRYLDRGDVREHNEVDVAQPSRRSHPGVRPIPGQDPVRWRERSQLRRVHRLLPGIEKRRVLLPPRDDAHVVAGLGQAMSQHGRVLSHPTLDRMGRADNRDTHAASLGASANRGAAAEPESRRRSGKAEDESCGGATAEDDNAAGRRLGPAQAGSSCWRRSLGAGALRAVPGED